MNDCLTDGSRVELRNQEGATVTVSELVSLDFSYLVRLGLPRS